MQYLFTVAAICLICAQPALCDSCRVAKPHTPTGAEDVYLHGKFPEAEALYRQTLADNPDDQVSTAGLARSLLHQQKVSDAAATIKSAQTAAPKSPILLTALAEVQYRQGLIVESGQSAAAAYDADICYARVHLIRARLARLNSMYATERKEIAAAHALDPYDPDIRSSWMFTLPFRQRIDELKKFLSEPVGLDEKEHKDAEETVERLEKINTQPLRRCHLVSAATSTKLPIQSIVGRQLRPRSWALMTKFNNVDAELELDSGSSGLLISRKVAEKARLQAVAPIEVGGLGDSGPQNGFMAYADSIRVGGLEFRDCLVDVSDSKYLAESDGLIGTNIFSDFVVSVDFPLHSLELSPLPARPGESPQGASLQTETLSRNPSADDRGVENSDSNSGEPEAVGPGVKRTVMGPRDRYIAPEMQSWFPVFRLGHDLIIPGLIDKNYSKLFLIDTGSEVTILSEDAASEIRRIYESPETKIRGLSGDVKHVYSGGAFNIRFADKNMTTREAAVLDLSGISKSAGVEVSGVIGLPALKLMTIRIDYRDGLVKFDYDPATVPVNR